jgi:sphingosine kinase
MRWLGGLRFTVQAVVRILFLRRYKATLRFRPSPTPAPAAADDVGSEVERKAAAAARAAAVRGAAAGAPLAGRPGWREISGDVQGVWALNVTWGAEDMHAAPGWGSARWNQVDL